MTNLQKLGRNFKFQVNGKFVGLSGLYRACGCDVRRIDVVADRVLRSTSDCVVSKIKGQTVKFIAV